jgi:hypothetical protein
MFWLGWRFTDWVKWRISPGRERERIFGPLRRTVD